jgi:hypothetical protein
MITVQLLGGACLRSGDAHISGPPARRHRIALLTLVVTAWPQPLSRDRAMALLWPERDLANARRLLNLAVHVLRSALGEGALVSTAYGLPLNPSHLSCDLTSCAPRSRRTPSSASCGSTPVRCWMDSIWTARPSSATGSMRCGAAYGIKGSFLLTACASQIPRAAPPDEPGLMPEPT